MQPIKISQLKLKWPNYFKKKKVWYSGKNKRNTPGGKELEKK